MSCCWRPYKRSTDTGEELNKGHVDEARPSGSIRTQPDACMQTVLATLKGLNNLPGSSIEQLNGAARLLMGGLQVDLVCVHVILDCQEGQLPVCIATAGHALGLAALPPVEPHRMTGRTSFEWVQEEQDGFARYVGKGTKSSEAKAVLPTDWQALHKATGYNAFATSPIKRCGKLQGTISVAASREDGWDETSILHSLSAVSVFLSSLLASPQLLQLSAMLAGALGACSMEALVEALSTGFQDHFKAVLNMKLHPRIALLPTTSSCIIHEQSRNAVTMPPIRARSCVQESPNSGTNLGWGASQEMQAKLKAIRKSTAVTSLDDFRSLATAISMNSEHMTLLKKQNTNTSTGFHTPVGASSSSTLSTPSLLLPSAALGSMLVGKPDEDPRRTSSLLFHQESSDLAGSSSTKAAFTDPFALEDALLQMIHTDIPCTSGAYMSAHSMPQLSGTLLEAVLAQEGPDKGTWIADLNTYMQQPGKPARDISLSANSPPLASLALACMPGTAASVSQSVLYPGLATKLKAVEAGMDTLETPWLAVYLTSPTTLTALQLQVVLRELQCVLRVLSKPLAAHLAGDLNLAWAMLRGNFLEDEQQTPPHKSRFALTKALAQQVLSRSQSSAPPSTKTMDEQQAMAKSRDGSTSTRACGASSAQPQTVYSSEAIKTQVAPLVAGLQDKLHHLLVESSINHCFNRPEDLKFVRADKLIARGGFGGVYRGLWQGLDVAIKVVPHRSESVDSAREAIELAVMSTLSHPNILQIQNYWTDTLVLETPLKPGEQRPNGLLHMQSSALQVAAPGSPSRPCEARVVTASDQLSFMSRTSSTSSLGNGAERCMIIVTELCDHGSLDRAIQKGVFFSQASSPRVPHLNTVAVLTTLLEIAMALRHMHSMQLVHCDLKPGNVLLKSSASDVRRFSTKLCDFGLVKIQTESSNLVESARRPTFTGTVTHSPPEVLRGDPNPAPAHDTYAFGILMFELSTTKGVYSGLTDRQVAEQVVWNNLRPEFPKGFYPQYKELAARCWAADASKRPSMDEVVSAVGAMLMDVRDRFMPFSPPTPTA